MTNTQTIQFDSARLSPAGLAVTWDGVAPPARGTLLLGLMVQRPDGSSLQFGTKWVDGDLAAVYAFDFAVARQQNAPDRKAATALQDGRLTTTYPREWLGTLLGEEDLHTTATANVDGADVQDWALDLDLS